MAKEVLDLRNELRQLKFKNNLLQEIVCSEHDSTLYSQMIKDGKKLPDGVFHRKDGNYSVFYTVYETDLSNDEKAEYFSLLQSTNIKTIRNCIVFFTVLAVISLILSFISGFIIGSGL